MQSDANERVRKVLEQFYATDGRGADALACAVVEGVSPHVRAFLSGEGVKGDDLDDLCQNVRLRLLQALRDSHAPQGRPIENAIAFAKTIARNLEIDAIRRQSVRPRVDSIEDLVARTEGNPEGVLPPDPANVEATVVAHGWFREQVWPIICELRPQQRAALLLGMRQDELLLLAGKISAVATALDTPLVEFLAFWRGLPLPDREIAQRLGIVGEGKTSAESRVSNLRKCALERVTRHVKRSE